MTMIIDLGKLRFSFAGEWDTSTVYETNDVVKYGGNVYVYTHALKTSGNLPTDGAYWALMVEGFKFKGVFSSTTKYKVGDGIAHGGKIYISVKDSTGKTPPDTTYWSQFADGIQYEGAWSNTADYQKNDVVVYGGSVYIAKQDGTNKKPSDNAYWDRFVDGISPAGVYNNAANYVRGDLVAYGPNLYRALGDTLGNLPTDLSHWELYIAGTSFRGEFDGATTYYVNDTVTYGGNLYRAKETVSTVVPTTAAKWDLVVSGFKYLGVYASTTAYKANEVVTFGGSLYRARADLLPNTSPTHADSWDRMVPGLRNRSAWATTTQYDTDDIITYGGNAFICVTPHASTEFGIDLGAGKWQKFNSGIRWRGQWDVAEHYLVDDIVRSGNTSYRAKYDTVGGTAPSQGNPNYEYLAMGAEGFVAKSGDIMTGPLQLVGDPTESTHAATKHYVDASHEAMAEPTGFNRGIAASMGIVEFSLDGSTVHRMNSDDTYSVATGQTKFAAGTPFEAPIAANKVFMYPATGESKFTFWQSGKKYELVTATANITPSQGTNYYFFDQGVLNQYASVTGDYIMRQAFVCMININPSTGQLIVFGNERHGITMDGATHYYLHTTSGTRYRSGLGVAGVTVGATAYTSTAAGMIYDEDIMINIPSRTTVPHLYMNGANWNLTGATSNFAHIVSSKAQYNQKIGAGNYALADIPVGSYAVMYFIATDCLVNPVMKVMGQKTFSTLSSARESAQTEPRDTVLLGLPSPEFLYMGAVVVDSTGAVQTLDNGAVYVDLRLVNISAGTNSSSAVQGIASDMFYSGTKSGLTATNVQDAIDQTVVKAIGSWVIKTANYTAAASDFIMADTRANQFSITLPANPADNATIRIVDAAGSFGTKPLTVLRNGKTLQGRAEDLLLNVNGASVALVFNSTFGWRLA